MIGAWPRPARLSDVPFEPRGLRDAKYPQASGPSPLSRSEVFSLPSAFHRKADRWRSHALISNSSREFAACRTRTCVLNGEAGKMPYVRTVKTASGATAV